MLQPANVPWPQHQCLRHPGIFCKNGACLSSNRDDLSVFKGESESGEKSLNSLYKCAFRMRAETEIDRAACGANRFICFVGDSHMRHAYNGVTSLFKGSLDWHGAPGASGAQKTDKSVMQVHPLLTRSSWPNSLSKALGSSMQDRHHVILIDARGHVSGRSDVICFVSRSRAE